MEKTTKKTH